MLPRTRIRQAILALGVIGLGAGCQSNYRSFSKDLSSKLERGEYQAANQVAMEKAASKKAMEQTSPSEETVVYLLEAGRCAQITGECEPAITHLARAEALMYPFYAEEAEASATEAVATTVVNQATSDYLGTPSDRVMCSTLLAIEQLAAGDPQAASISFKRAQNWQENLKVRFEAEIAAGDDAMRQKLDSEKDEKKAPVSSAAVQSATSSVLQEHYASLAAYAGYADFGNPFFNHAYGIFQLTNPTFSSSGTNFELDQVVRLNPEAFEMIEPDREADGRLSASGTTWVYFMTGLAPSFREFRLDIPIPIGDVNYVSAAFPVMEFDESFASGMTVSDGETTATSRLLADLASIRAAEFKAKLPQIIAQEILSSAIKAAGTYAAGQAGGSWAQLGGIIYQAVTTSADTRCWHSVPARIELARIPTPERGSLEFSNGRPLGSATVAPGSNNLIIVTLPDSTTPTASIRVVPLTAGPSEG